MTLMQYIEYMLQNHKRIRESIEMIKRNMFTDDKDEIISALSLPGMGFDRIMVSPTNVPSDRVASIAECWMREQCEQRKAISELRAKVSLQECELKTLDRAVSHLSEPARNIILLMYFECLPWRDIRDRTKYSNGTLAKYRNDGIIELESYYQKYCTNVTQNELIGIEL